MRQVFVLKFLLFAHYNLLKINNKKTTLINNKQQSLIKTLLYLQQQRKEEEKGAHDIEDSHAH